MITDNFFDIMLKLRNLDCYECPNLQNDGLAKLILNSNHLKTMRLNCCVQTSVSGFRDSVLASKIENLTLEIDSSRIEDFLVENYCLVTKKKERVVIKIRKLCYPCFKSHKVNSDCVYCCDIEEIEEVF